MHRSGRKPVLLTGLGEDRSLWQVLGGGAALRTSRPLRFRPREALSSVAQWSYLVHLGGLNVQKRTLVKNEPCRWGPGRKCRAANRHACTSSSGGHCVLTEVTKWAGYWFPKQHDFQPLPWLSGRAFYFSSDCVCILAFMSPQAHSAHKFLLSNQVHRSVLPTRVEERPSDSDFAQTKLSLVSKGRQSTQGCSDQICGAVRGEVRSFYSKISTRKPQLGMLNKIKMSIFTHDLQGSYLLVS